MSADNNTGDDVVVVGADERRLVTEPPMAGAVREAALAGEDHWAGVVRTEPGSETGWHHHGEHTTYVYVTKGRAALEWGPGGGWSAEAGPGDFARVPGGVVHRELNPGDEANEMVVLRVGRGAPVIPVDGPPPS